MKKNIIVCILYIIMIFTVTACSYVSKEQESYNDLVTVSGQPETIAEAMPDFKMETEIKTIGYLPLPDGWIEFATENVSYSCHRLYSETGLAAIAITKITPSNEMEFGDITDMEAYVRIRMSSQYVLKSTEAVESEYGNIVNKIVVGAGDAREAEELHYIVLSVDGSVTVDIVVIDENYIEEMEKYAAHISIR